jgi:hypothetical protein
MRWLEYTKLFVELIKGIAWPVVVAGILWWFRHPILAQLSRVTEVGPTGVKLGPPTVQEVTPPPSAGTVIASARGEAGGRGEAIASPDAAVGIGQIKGRYPPEVLEPALEAFRRELAKIAKTDAEKIDVLVHVVAGLNIQLSHERTYRQIFGSQIALLHTMQGLLPMSSDQVSSFYDDAARSYPELYKDIPFEHWLGFLTFSGLITERDGRYEITDYGRAFLKYLVDSQLPDNKPL